MITNLILVSVKLQRKYEALARKIAGKGFKNLYDEIRLLLSSLMCIYYIKITYPGILATLKYLYL